MPKVDLLNMEGKKVGDIELSSEIFDVEVNEYVMHDVVVNYLCHNIIRFNYYPHPSSWWIRQLARYSEPS